MAERGSGLQWTRENVATFAIKSYSTHFRVRRLKHVLPQPQPQPQPNAHAHAHAHAHTHTHYTLHKHTTQTHRGRSEGEPLTFVPVEAPTLVQFFTSYDHHPLTCSRWTNGYKLYAVEHAITADVV